MSLIHNPELVRLLTAERLAEAQEARRSRDLPNFARVLDRMAGFARRTTGLRSTPAACACE